jgi:hypothetical protein
MDANKIFGLFSGEYSSEEPHQGEEISLDNFEEHPIYWVGMFKKLIHNHKVFNIKIQEFVSKVKKEIEQYNVEVAGEYVTYNRAWYYIQNIDITNIKHQDALIYYMDEYLETYLKFSISFWEELEEYEKCAHLKKIHDFCMKLSN